MSRIFGIWNLDGAPIDRAAADRMGDALTHPGLDEADIVAGSHYAFGCRLFRVTPQSTNERQPLSLPSGSVLAFDGRLDNRDELIAALRTQTDFARVVTDPHLVGAAYEMWGPDCAAHL